MVKVSLHNLLFFSYHGIYEEEQLLGGEFEVNVDLFYEEPVSIIQHLDQTIDYSSVYKIIERRMKQSTPLLETIATQLAAEIKQAFAVTKEITVRIKKVNPPIVSFRGNVAVEFNKKY
ncbi:MAG: dihydroneopterin aldolase [Sphingobacteriales bacterium]|nr:dihydroneopterin aldolase [Sphingobacteriales bacterium]MBI3717748.1 dihydroneopterin aldolase [Sphingobacteriales bacterium]